MNSKSWDSNEVTFLTWMMEFMKHVFPRFDSPQSPGCTLSPPPSEL